MDHCGSCWQSGVLLAYPPKMSQYSVLILVWKMCSFSRICSAAHEAVDRYQRSLVGKSVLLLTSLMLDVLVEAVPMCAGELERAERHCGRYPSLVQLHQPGRDGSRPLD
jgi:hypothetical protein